MMRRLPNNLIALIAVSLLSFQGILAQTVLLNYDFRSTLPAEITLGGTAALSTGGSIGSCSACSPGRVNVPLNAYMQVDVSSCSVFNVRMKSSGGSARTVSILYKKSGEPDYTLAGTVSVPQTGSFSELTTLFPMLITAAPISLRISNGASGGEFHIHDIYVESNSSVSSDAKITAFKIPAQIGSETIDAASGSIGIQVPIGTSLTSVVPELITLSAHATISPAPDAAQNFSGQVVYTVTAQDGVTTKQWNVNVFEVASSEKEITAFKLLESQTGDAVINANTATVTVAVPLVTDLSNLVPQVFTVSPDASVNPVAGTARNFSSPVEYVVTAQDNSEKIWTVIVNKIDPEETFVTYEAEQAAFTGKLDAQHAGYSGTGFIDFLAAGENQIIFTVCQQEAGARSARFGYALGKNEDRSGNLYVNDVFVKTLAFAPTVSFTDWAEETAIVNLTAGVNNIKITWDDTDGPNLDKLVLGGAACATYSLAIHTTNGGTVVASPERSNLLYFQGETVTLLAENKPDLTFAHWGGDVTGATNPVQVVMNGNKDVTANFTVVNTYTLTVNTQGIGEIILDPPGGQYAEGTVVTLTANSALGSVFQGWSGALTGSASPASVTMNANKTVTGTFTSNISLDFDTPVGFASVNTGSLYPNFNGPVTGGQHAEDTLWITGPADFDKLAQHLYNRNRAYKNNRVENGVPNTPLVIVFQEGVYPEGSSSSSAWGNHMMTIQEQGDLTIIGQGNVTVKFGFNIKRSWNILIRNLAFQDYYDDGINIGEPETHHVWIDHCTIGHPTTMPVNTEHPDGGIDVKNGASYVTISWCNYRNSWKTGLVGHSDSNGSEDSGKLKVTYFGNYFYNTNSRNPRVRFGEVHVLNNLEENVMLYGIAASNLSQVYAENNFFLNMRWPMYADRAAADFRSVYGNNTDNTFTSKTGNKVATGLKQVGNAYDDSGLPVITAQINPAMLNPGGRSIAFDEFNTEQVFNPAAYYTYTPFPAAAVRTIVPLFAGAGKVNFFQSESDGETGSIVTTGVLEPFTQALGQPPVIQTYTVSATSITGPLTITPPAAYEVSANGGTTWFTNTEPLVMDHTSGMIAATTISVKLNASAAGSYAGSISHAASGAALVLTNVTGTTALAPGSIPEGTWTLYQANELPNLFSPAFVTSQQSGTFSNTILSDPDKENNNLLRMETDAVGNNNQWRQNLVAGTQNLTLVIKVKGNDANKNLVLDADLDFNVLRSQIRILSDGTFTIANGTPNTPGNLGADPLAWNMFRITKKGNEIALYVNEAETPIYTGTAASGGTNNYFRFGDGWGSGRISSDIDWVIWDVTGAYSPAETSIPYALRDEEDPNEPVAQITIDGSLQNFVQSVGTPSSVQSYTVSGTLLTNDITITPPASYEISKDNGVNWAGSTSSIVLPEQEGTVEATVLSVRLNSTVAGPFSGTISHVSGTTTASVSVAGIATSGVVLPPGTNVIVAADGSGDFTTVQAAINAAPAGRTTPYIIFIRNGIYKEKINVPAAKPFLHFIGESVANTILTYDDYSGKTMPGGGVFGTANSASVIVAGADFTAINITFENTTGDAPQALAIQVNADRAAFKNCRFLGGQDTILTNGAGNRQYFNNCYIDGVVDFIFGNAVAVFDSCVVYAKTRTDGLTGSYITAANTPVGQQYGYVFRNSIVPANRGVTQYVLGRPWQNSTGASPMSYPKVVFLNSAFGKNIVKPEGWAVWDAGTVTSSIYYAEYKSKKFDGTGVNTSQRVPWSFQLTDAEAAIYTNATLFGDWDPCTVSPAFCEPAAKEIAVSNLKATKGVTTSSLTWNISWPMKDVTYQLYRSSDNTNFTIINEQVSVNDSTVNFSYTDNLPASGVTYTYYVSASAAGKFPHITERVEISSIPAITVTGTLNNFVQGLGLPSASQAYTVSAVNLTQSLVVTPPPGFEVSANSGTTWFTHNAPLELTPVAGTVATTTLAVRLNATQTGNVSGDITHASNAAETISKAVSGTVQSDPLPVSYTLLHWPLTENKSDNAAVRSEAVMASTPSFSRLHSADGTTVAAVPAYSMLHGQAFGPSSNGDGSWGVAAGGNGGTLHRKIYEEFTVTANQSHSVRVDSIVVKSSFYNTASNTKLALVYSKTAFTTADSTNVSGGIGYDGNPLLSTANGAFATPVLLINETAGTTGNLRFALAGPNGVMLAPGETLTIRMYFSCGSTTAGRYGKLKDVFIKGFAETIDNTPAPEITVTGALAAFAQTVGNPSDVKTYTVSGANLTANITVTPPQHIEVSADGGVSWKTNASPLVLTQTGGSISHTTISVRMNATDAHVVNATISHVSTGAERKTITVNGISTVVTSTDPELKSSVKAYPNPVKGVLTIEHPSTSYPATIMVYSQLGMKVGSIMVTPGENRTHVDVTSLANGIYFATYSNDAGRIKLKVIKIN